jgi:hypothetical protein
MIDFNENNNHNALIVGVGLVIYGRKIKKNVKIKVSELTGDLMQLGAMFVGAMSFFSGLELVGMRPHDTWQTVMVTILFAMSFETYFQRARDALQARFALVTAAILGQMPDDAVMKVPGGKGLPSEIEVDVPHETDDDESHPAKAQRVVRHVGVQPPKGKLPKEIQDELDKLD